MNQVKRSSVEVAIRVRPMRTELDESSVCWEVHHNQIQEKQNPDSNFKFDRIYGMNSTTQEIYDKSVKGIIHHVCNGYNGTVFAYGQTGSGKSYTMLGTNSNDVSITGQAVKDLFMGLERERAKDGVDIKVYVAMLEIYNEQLRDLLIPTTAVAMPLTIRENEHGVYVHNATRRLVTSWEQCMDAIHNEAESRRTQAATSMNERSSRSHCLIRILVEKEVSFDADSDESSDGDEMTVQTTLTKKIVSSLNLVDLAGSERIAKTGATGMRMVEGGHINKSLTCLTTVINRLTDDKSGFTHIPYRDSKLTHLLKTAIGGNSFTTVFCCMTPAEQHQDESRSTLQFAARAKTIKNEVQLNEISDPKTKIRELELEIKKFKRQMVAMELYYWSKDLKIKKLKEEGGAGAAAEVDQLQQLVDQLTEKNEELGVELENLQAVAASASAGGGAVATPGGFDAAMMVTPGGYVDPMMMSGAFADDEEKQQLRIQKEELEQRLQEVQEDHQALQENFAESEALLAEMEDEVSQKEDDMEVLKKSYKAVETQLTNAQQLEKSLEAQIAQLQQQRKTDEERMMEQARGDELMEQLTQLHVEHNTLKFEHNALMDMYTRSEIEKASENTLLGEQVDEYKRKNEEAHSSMQQFNSFAWRLLAVANMATHGEGLAKSECVGLVKEHQVDQAIKGLTAFISSRASRAPGMLSGGGGSGDEGKSAGGAASGPRAPVGEGEAQLQKRIEELEKQLIAKDAQRDIIIDTKLKRIQDLVLRLHTTNQQLNVEIVKAAEENARLTQIIKKDHKLAQQLGDSTPLSASEMKTRAEYAHVPAPPHGHN